MITVKDNWNLVHKMLKEILNKNGYCCYQQIGFIVDKHDIETGEFIANGVMFGNGDDYIGLNFKTNDFYQFMKELFKVCEEKNLKL